MTVALRALIDKAHKDGWASAPGTLDQVRSGAGLLDLTEVPSRRFGPAIAALRPQEPADAPANSLSARYGTGEQPLHTDGAHLEQPPDLVVLACQATSATPTRLWNLSERGKLRRLPEYLKHGIFLVHGGGGADSFLSPAYADTRFRYDPGCMTPCDARALQAARYFERALKRAEEHRWDKPGTVLIIDNRRVLHARASAQEEPEREIQRIAYRLKGDA